MKNILYMLCTIGLITTSSYAGTITTVIQSTDSTNKPLGQVTFKDTPYGLLITPHLDNLPQGLHGFHIHQKPNCGSDGQDAGGHYDPENTDTHRGPYGNGHLGDLPALYVNDAGKAELPTIAPKLKTKDLNNVSVMIHEGGDTYSDIPKLGGGGARIGCGVLKN